MTLGCHSDFHTNIFFCRERERERERDSITEIEEALSVSTVLLKHYLKVSYLWQTSDADDTKRVGDT
jgi:hypothetical protein